MNSQTPARTTAPSGPPVLVGSVVLVTGGGSGIGRAIAITCAEAGADVAVLDLRGAESTAEEIAALGRRTWTLATDVSSRAAVHEAVNRVAGEADRLDGLVCAAGIAGRTPALGEGMDDFSEQEIDDVIAVNLKGTLWCIQAALPHLRSKGGGIVTIGSLAGRVGGSLSGPHYVATKGAIHALTKWAARYGAAYGIRANAIAPGLIDTAMTSGLPRPPGLTPIGREGVPEDVAQAALYLLSPQSNFVTGIVLDVNGGFYAA
jgi:3-oxoacyl-[acyl-carrier protein] reductase